MNVAEDVKMIWHLFAQSIKTRMTYRWDFFASCVSVFAAQTAGLITLWVIFHNTQVLGTWTAFEVLFIYGMAMVSQSLFSVVSEAFWFFPNQYIMNGEFDRLLLRPLNPIIQMVFEHLGLDELPTLAVGVLIIGISAHKLGLVFSLSDIFLMSLFLGSGALLLIGIFLGLISASFWFEDRIGLAPPVYNFMAFGRYPLTIFNRVVQMVMTFILPFGFMAFFPSQVFLSDKTDDYLVILGYGTPLVALIVFVIGYRIWAWGIRNYRSTGS